MSGGIVSTIGALSPSHDVLTQMGLTMGIGGLVGAIIAQRVQITDLPQLVAAFHSFVGLAAVLTAFSSFMIDACEFSFAKGIFVRYFLFIVDSMHSANFGGELLIRASSCEIMWPWTVSGDRCCHMHIWHHNRSSILNSSLDCLL